MPALKLSDIPGLREAIKRENDVRDAAFAELTTSICGIEIRQMTPRDLLILEGIGNAVICGGMPSPEHLADFLWKLSPSYKQNSWLRRFLFGRRIRRINYLEAVRACWKYLEETFQDSPSSSGPGGIPFASWPAHLITSLSESPVRDKDVIMNTPLKQLFQFIKCIRRKNNPECPMHNPSDKVKGDFIRKMNLDVQRERLIAVLKRRTN